MNRDDAVKLTVGRDMWSTAPLDDVPSAKMADGPMGIASGRVDERDVSVLTPCGMALAATWDRKIVEQVGAIVGGEAKRLGVDLLLAPNLNLARTPNAGRAFEMFGEDPLLAGTLGVAWIGGLQSRNVGSVAKHLVCNDTETARDSYDAIVDEATLREVYLLPFEMAARAGCAGLMAAYNKLGGTHCAENAYLLTTIVRDDWGYEGFTVCDWFGSKSTAPAMTAGLDLEMPGPARFYGKKLASAIDAGDVAERSVMLAAGRIARAATLWVGGTVGAEPGDRSEILAEAAASSFVLLRNESDLLPIAPGSIRTLAVIGPNAAAPCFQGGTFAKIALRPDAVMPLDAIRARYGADTEILFAPGCDPAPRLPAMPVTPARDIGDGCTIGMTVDFFESHDFSGTPLASETRNTNSLTWFSGMPGVGAFDRAAGICASGYFTAPVTGSYRFHIGGTGAVTLRIDGKDIFEVERTIAPADIMGVLKAGDSDAVDVPLIAGETILVEAQLRFMPARAQGIWYGIRSPGDAETLLAEAEALAARTDAVLLVIGETADSGVESKDRDTTALPPEQLRLVERIFAANPNVVVIANVAHAFDIGFAAPARALLLVWYPGEAFGDALADVVAGRREPSGRMPVTIAARDEDYPTLDSAPDASGRLFYPKGGGIGYRVMTTHGIAPAAAFGAGLGYGRLHYDSATGHRTADGGVIVHVTVANVGDRPSAAVAQIYRTDDGIALAGFAKQTIEANSRACIEVVIPPIALRCWSDGAWRDPLADITLAIGASSADLAMEVAMS